MYDVAETNDGQLVYKEYRFRKDLVDRPDDRYQEMSFAGVHSDVGGQFPDDHKLSDMAALPLKPELQLLTPGTSGDLRVQVEEYESLPADPPPGEQMPSTAERLVYADHFPL